MAITYRITKGSALDYTEMDANFQTLEDKDIAQDADIADIADVALAKMGGDAFMHVQDQKPQGTYGGTFTAGAWRTRDLNTVLTNTITGASLDSNQITLPAGKYYIEASAPGMEVTRHQAKIQVISPVQSEVLIGTSEVSYRSGTGSVTQSRSFISGIIQISENTTLELQHECTTTATNYGFGVEGESTTGVFSDVRIWRIGDYIAP